MLNQFVIVGRVQKIENNIIEVIVPKPSKEDGEDIISINCSFIEKTIDYLQAGTLVGIKGKIETNSVLRAEKITFLSNINKTHEEN